MKSDAAFMDALIEGHLRSLWAAAEIVRRYPTCHVRAHVDFYPPQSIHRGAFRDPHDLLVNDRFVVEVKGRPSEDLRTYPRDTILLGETYKLDVASIHGVVMIGANRYPMWFFPARDSHKWGKRVLFSGPDRRQTESWCVPVSLAHVWDADA